MKKFIGLALSIILVLSMTAFHAAAEVPAIEKTDRFDVMETESGLYMISRDGELIIIVSDDTEIVFEDGLDARECLADEQTLSELLDGRNLTVSYTIATHSLPPQTTPEKIVILYEIAVHPIYEFTPEEIEELFKTDGENLPVAITPPIYIFTPEEIKELFPINGEIVVNGEIIEAPVPYYNDDGIIMVPLRAIAEELGFDVNWDDEVQGVRLGVAINLWIGRDYYTVGRMAPIELGAAPELTGVFTYVPYNFFQVVVTGYNIYQFQGQVIIEPNIELE